MHRALTNRSGFGGPVALVENCQFWRTSNAPNENAGLEGTLQNWPGASSVSENRSGLILVILARENNKRPRIDLHGTK